MSTGPSQLVSSRPRVVLVTASAFWRPISGDHARTAALVARVAIAAIFLQSGRTG